PIGTGDVPVGRGVHPPNTIDYKPFVRAAVDNLTAWIAGTADPPPSRYPRLDDGTLDADLRPSTDADGNEVAGLRHPDVSVPLGTLGGWTSGNPPTGGADRLVRATVSTTPFSAEFTHPRYPSREIFLEKINAAAQKLAVERYMLPDDVAGVIGASSERW